MSTAAGLRRWRRSTGSPWGRRRSREPPAAEPMVWLTSQSVAALVPGCLAVAALVAIGSRLLIRALVPASAREGSNAIAAPLMPALGAAFAILVAITLANEA